MSAYTIHVMTLYNLQCLLFLKSHNITGANHTPHTWKKEKFCERAIFFKINFWRQDITRWFDGDEMCL